jgi:leader peptidase (prepilin peptidase) / N-methyltransferase
MDASTLLMIQQVAVLLAGCCIGSFFNVLIHRLPAKQSIVLPGSHCPGCGHPIASYDNVPLLSFFVLGGKCRHCGERISTRYPLVEALAGLLALLLFRRYGWHAQFPIEFLFVSILIVVTFIDLDTYIIPDVFSLSGTVLGFGLSFLTPRLSWQDSLIGILAGGGFFLLVAIAYQYLRHQEGLGGGDIKLLAMIGAFMGLPGVILTVLVASVVGTFVGLFVMYRSRKGLKAMIPFGPFLSLGAVVYVFLGQSFFRWYLGAFLGG